MIKRTLVLAALFLLAGCHGSVALRSGTGASAAPVPSSASSVSVGKSGLQVNVNSGSSGVAGLVILGVMIADGVDYVRGTGRWTREAPPMAEDRKVNRQDCTRPIEYSYGNVMCR